MILDKFRLDGKVAVVTGSNTGLGQGICRAFVEAGAKVAGVSRRPSDETAKMCGKNFYNIIADLGSLDCVNQIIENKGLPPECGSPFLAFVQTDCVIGHISQRKANRDGLLRKNRII